MRAGKARISAVAAALLIAAGAVTAAQAATPTFKTGTYKGTTSQGEKFALRLVKTTSCGHSHGLCLIDATQGYVKLTCPEGASGNEYIDPFDAPVPASGKLHESTVNSEGAKITETFLVKHNGTISGTYAITNVPDSIDPESQTGTCSANVTYTLRLA
ncbi:MAG TPA: hypothetical protein VN804_03385 [Solirubrobacteraceae bacterium]|nr:hypothetical protein [Solirubrobacteraceae bacterium]